MSALSCSNKLNEEVKGVIVFFVFLMIFVSNAIAYKTTVYMLYTRIAIVVVIKSRRRVAIAHSTTIYMLYAVVSF